MNNIVKLLNNELDKAIHEDEVPVAALIVHNGKIISISHNKRIKLCDPLAHAEVLCIQKAAKKLKSWNLNDCELYVTLEPCSMCKEIINSCRIKKVFYFLNSEKKINNNVLYIKLDSSLINNKFQNKIKDFFKNKR